MKKIKSSGAKPTEDALRKSELAYRTLVETSHDLIWSVDADGRWTFVNSASRRIYGYEPAEMLGRPFMDFQSPEQAEKDLAVFNLIKAGAPHFNYETEHRRKDGSSVWLNFNAIVQRDEKGTVLGTTGTAQDITARKEAEAALRENEVLLRNIFDGMSVFVGVIATDGCIREVNQVAVAASGMSHAALIGKPLTDVMWWSYSPEVKDRVRGFLHRAAHGEVVREELIARIAGGRFITVDATFSPLRDGTGRVTQIIASGVDITERKVADEALRQSEGRFRRIMDSDMIGMLFWSTAGKITAANDAFLRTVGYTQDDVRAGRVHWRDMTPPEYRALDEKALREMASTAICTPFEKEYFRKDGSRVAVLIGGATLPGQPDEGIAFVLEISERKKTEQARDHSLSLMRATLESTADGILVVNQAGKIETYNRHFLEMWGVTDKLVAGGVDSEVIQWALDQLVEPEKFLEKVRDLYAHPRAESFDTLIFKDGRTFERFSRPQFIGEEVAGRVWSFRDITARRRTEVALRDSEEKFRAVFAQSPLALVLTTVPEGRVADANAAAELLLGRKLSEVRGKTTLELNVWVDLADRERNLQMLQRDGAVSGIEVRLRRSDGVEIAVHYNSRVVHIGGQTYPDRHHRASGPVAGESAGHHRHGRIVGGNFRGRQAGGQSHESVAGVQPPPGHQFERVGP